MTEIADLGANELVRLYRRHALSPVEATESVLRRIAALEPVLNTYAALDADAALATMTDNPVLIHVPVGTGASGREPLRKLYREIFIPQAPPDFELELLTRSIGQNRVTDEFIVRFTHTVQMDWFAPGVAPTGRRLVVPHVGIVTFEGGKISSEHIY